MTNPEVVATYWQAIADSDSETLETLVTDDIEITGPLVSYTDRQSFLGNARAVMSFVKEITILRQFDDADEVVSILDMRVGDPAKPGVVRIIEHAELERGRIRSIRLVFDSAVLLPLMPEPLHPKPR